MTGFETSRWTGAAAAVVMLIAGADVASAQRRAPIRSGEANIARVDTVSGDTLSIRVGRQGAEIVRYRENGEEVLTIRRRIDGEGGSDDRRPARRMPGDREPSVNVDLDLDDDEMDDDNDGDETHVYRTEDGDTVRVERRRRVRRRGGRTNWHWNRNRDRDRPRDRFAASNGIFGGIEGSYLKLETDGFNPQLAPSGLAFDEDMTLLGGGIFIQGDHLRLGYVGAGWTQEEESSLGDVKRAATARLGYGAFTAEYVWGFARRVELGVGGMIGQGRVKLGLQRQTGGDPTFDAVVRAVNGDSVGRYTTTLEARPFLIGPRASVRVKLFDGVSLMATGSYLFGETDKWRQNLDLFDDKGLEVTGGPSYKLTQPSVQLGLYFGS